MQKNYNLITLGRAQRKKVKQNGQKKWGQKRAKPAARHSMLSSALPPFKRTYRLIFLYTVGRLMPSS